MESENDFLSCRDKYECDSTMHLHDRLPIENSDSKTEAETLTLQTASDSIRIPARKGDDLEILEGTSLDGCEIHNGEQKRFFCKNCRIFVCASCVVLEHGTKGHSWMKASDATGLMKEEIGKILHESELKLEKVNNGISELEKKIEKVPLRMQAFREDVTEACDDAIKHFTQYLQNKRLQLLERINILEKSGIDVLEESKKEGQEIQTRLARVTESGHNMNTSSKVDDILELKSNLQESLKVIPVQEWSNQGLHAKVGALDPELRFIKGSPGTSSQQCWCQVGELVHPGKWKMTRKGKLDRPLGDLVTAIAALPDGSVALGYQMNGVYIVDSAGNQRHIWQGVGHIVDIALMEGNKLAILDADGIIKVMQLPGGQMKTSDLDAQHSHRYRCLSASKEGLLFAGVSSHNSIHILRADGSNEGVLTTGVIPLRIAVSSKLIAVLHHPVSITIMDMTGRTQCVIHEDQWAYASVCASGVGDFFILSAMKSNPKSLRIGQYTADGTMVETVIDNYPIAALGWLNPRISASSGKLMVCVEDELIVLEREMLVLD